MNNLLLQTSAGWEQWIGESSVAVLLVFLFLGFLLKALPTWREIKIAEFTVRTKEAEASGQLSISLTSFANAQNQLANALGQLGETVKDIAIEQKKATDNVMILQRVNANESEKLSNSVDNLIERMDTLEENLKDTEIYATRPKAIKKT